MQQYSVKDGTRELRFTGTRLSASSSRIGDKPRWVEFELYVTQKGSYVLSRVGKSIYYHGDDCYTVTRNRLSAVDESDLAVEAIPCPECKPARINPEGVYPETPRYWAQSSDSPQGVIASLMQYDENQTEYLTNVARRLLEDASEVDARISDAFYVDNIE